MLACVHAEEGQITAQRLQFLAQIADRYRFTIFKRIREFLTEKQDFHTHFQAGGCKNRQFQHVSPYITRYPAKMAATEE